MARSAEGIPDREVYGDTSKIPLRKLLTYVDQLHKARQLKTAALVRKIPKAEAMTLLRSIRRKLGKGADKKAVRNAFGVGTRHNHEFPKVVDIDGKKTLLHYRAAPNQDSLKSSFDGVHNGNHELWKVRLKNESNYPEEIMKRHVRSGQLALSTSTSLDTAKQFLSGRGNRPLIGVYGTPLEKLIQNQKNKTQAAMVNARHAKEQEITQLSGDNLLKVRKYAPLSLDDFTDIIYRRIQS